MQLKKRSNVSWPRLLVAALLSTLTTVAMYWLDYLGVIPLWSLLICLPLVVFVTNMFLRAASTWLLAIVLALPQLVVTPTMLVLIWKAKLAAQGGGAFEIFLGIGWIGATDVVPMGVTIGIYFGLHLMALAAFMARAGTGFGSQQ